MPYEPKTTLQYLQEMAARVIARTELSDLNEGSVLTQILGAVSEELAQNDFRLKVIRDSFFMSGVTGVDLDRRVSELPLGGVSRKPPAPATGPVLRLERLNDAEEGEVDYPKTLTVPAGVQFAREDRPSELYELTSSVTFGVGEGVKEALDIRAVTPGKGGNCAAHTITVNVNATDDIIAITNTQGLSNGRHGETDTELKGRAVKYLSSLARCQPAGLESFCTAYVDPMTGIQLQYAKVFEDPGRRGYVEVYVDDGQGLQGAVKDGDTVTSEIPASGPQTVLYHQRPATLPIQKIKVVRSDGTILFFHHQSGHYVSLHERGIVYFKPGALQTGDVWTIEDYQVYTNPISSLQEAIEGDPSNPYFNHGWRAAGTRVVVKPAVTLFVKFKLHILAVENADFLNVAKQAKEDIVAFCSMLAPGETLFVAQLVEALMSNPQVRSLRLFDPATDKFMDDQPTDSPYKAIRTTLENIIITPAVEE